MYAHMHMYAPMHAHICVRIRHAHVQALRSHAAPHVSTPDQCRCSRRKWIAVPPHSHQHSSNSTTVLQHTDGSTTLQHTDGSTTAYYSIPMGPAATNCHRFLCAHMRLRACTRTLRRAHEHRTASWSLGTEEVSVEFEDAKDVTIEDTRRLEVQGLLGRHTMCGIVWGSGLARIGSRWDGMG